MTRDAGADDECSNDAEDEFELDSGVAAELRAAAERFDGLKSELAERGLEQSELDTVADAVRSVENVLDRWEARATDWDDFEGYVEFRNDLAATLESIPEDVPHREAFLEADGCVKTGGVSKSLRGSDFDAARETLEPARECAALREEIDAAREDLRDTRKRAKRRRTELEARVRTLERLLELGEADLDAPIERLRDPIAEYNERITDRFETFRREASAEEFLAFVEQAAHTPFVDIEAPPPELLEYVHTADASEYSIDELLEYADYSPSKLSHYVDDENLLKRRVGTNRTYLERLSADPLRIEWPPRPGEQLRFRIDELVSLAGRIGDEPTIATLRSIRTLSKQDAYERLRLAAAAIEELTDEERRRLEDGTVEAERSAVRAELDRIDAVLAEIGPDR